MILRLTTDYRLPTNLELRTIQRVSSRIKNISPNIHPECNEKINNERRAHGEERDINEIFSNGAGGNAHLFTYGCANPEHMPFNKMFETIQRMQNWVA